MIKLIFTTLGVMIFCISYAQLKKTKNESIIKFVSKNLDQKIGTGECSDLVMNAKFHSRNDKSINSKKIKPGDFISFKNVELSSKNGSSIYLPEHHAIIFKVIDKTKFIIAHQNHNGNKTVQLLEIDISTKLKGEISISHP